MNIIKIICYYVWELYYEIIVIYTYVFVAMVFYKLGNF